MKTKKSEPAARSFPREKSTSSISLTRRFLLSNRRVFWRN